MSDADLRAVAAKTARRVTAAVAVTAAVLAFAGLLPGESILLGLLTSDWLADVARGVIALASALLLLVRDVGRLGRGLGRIGLAMLVAGALTLVDSHLFGFLAHGATRADTALALACGAVALVVARTAAVPQHPHPGIRSSTALRSSAVDDRPAGRLRRREHPAG